jgi:PAS domain-containing protein
MNGSLLADLSAFDNFDAAVVRITDDGRLDYLNRAARALLDCAVDEAIDLHMLFREQQEYALARENLQQQEGRSISYRTVLRRPWLGDSAAPIPVCIRAFPNVHMDGSPYGAIAWIDDMREKEARAAINAALATSMDKQQLLDAVAEQVRTLVPFDEFHITMIGRSRTRMR